MKNQTGIVLFLSLIFLLVISLFMVTGGQQTLLQEKISASFRESNNSLEAASSAVVAAEQFIESLAQISSFNDEGAQGLFSKGSAPVDLFDRNVWNNKQQRYQTVAAYNGVSPKYFIELLGDFGDDSSNIGVNILGYGQTVGGAKSTLFKIVAYSPGAHDISERVIVSYYSKYF